MPRILIKTVRGNLGRLLTAVLTRPRHYCVYCDRHVLTFLPYKGGSSAAPKVMATSAVIGSDLDNFSCMRCGSTDRERHLFMYMRALGMLEKLSGTRILHFAPESKLPDVLRKCSPEKYVQADLFPKKSGILKLDLENIDAPAESFDLVIANHVLEHVGDDLAAMREIYRVLSPGGTAILQTPYASAILETQADPNVEFDPRLNLELYGQEDHLRLFGMDIFDRIQSVGFELGVVGHEEALVQYEPREYGVNAREPFMRFYKSNH